MHVNMAAHSDTDINRNVHSTAEQTARFLYFSCILVALATLPLPFRVSAGPLLFTVGQICWLLAVLILGMLYCRVRRVSLHLTEWLFLSFFAYVAFSIVVMKETRLWEMRQYKAIIGPALCSYCATRCYLRRLKGNVPLLYAIVVVGIVVGSLVYFRMAAGLGIIERDNSVMRSIWDELTISYSTTGNLSVLGLIISIGLILSRQRVYVLLGLPAVPVLGAIMLRSENRASMLALLAAGACALGARSIAPKVFSLLLGVFLAVTICVAVCPSNFADLTSVFDIDLSGGGQSRVLDTSGYARDLRERLGEWDMIVTTPSHGFPRWAFGVEWEKASNRVRYIGHPHNLWVWCFVMGGIPGVIIVAVSVFIVLSRLYVAWWHGTSPNRLIVGVTLLAFCPLFLVATTNSILPGTEAVWGVLVATAVTLTSSSRVWRMFDLVNQQPIDRFRE